MLVQTPAIAMENIFVLAKEMGFAPPHIVVIPALERLLKSTKLKDVVETIYQLIIARIGMIMGAVYALDAALPVVRFQTQDRIRQPVALQDKPPITIFGIKNQIAVMELLRILAHAQILYQEKSCAVQQANHLLVTNGESVSVVAAVTFMWEKVIRVQTYVAPHIPGR